MRRSALLTAAILLGACMPAEAPIETPVAPVASPASPATAPTPRLEMLWRTAGFSEPEGAALAPDGGYFISNVAGDAGAKDGNGYISRVAVDGAVTQARWAEGLDAPKGMVVHEGVLYVADVGRIARFDASSAARLADIPVKDAKFLNDMTVWNGEVLVSDSGAKKILKLVGDSAIEFGTSAQWDGVNGLLGDGERLLIATMSDGHLIDHRAGGETRLATGMKNADGIGLYPGRGLFVSTWPGEIYFIADGSTTPQRVLDTTAEKILQNDLSLFGETIIVPNMLPGTVTAWAVRWDTP